jgi:hypothetical protein
LRWFAGASPATTCSRYGRRMPNDIKALAGILATSGAVHLAKPEVYEPIEAVAV